ncbi:MAG: hypothetical protein C4555_06370 [Dehalococcoidia bacterium]|nr:MAG: hypothetical protein C4555_06370 [Dehalococcoidia bacterium]
MDLTADMLRTCKKCGVDKPLDQFRLAKSVQKGKTYYCRLYTCKICINKQHKEWRERNPEYQRAWQQKNIQRQAEYHQRWVNQGGKVIRLRYKLKSLYGLSIEEYVELSNKQGGVCAIYRQSEPKGRLCVDHDHQTGQVRGLLCQQCNKALGALRDSIENCLAAAKYLREAVMLRDGNNVRGVRGSLREPDSLCLPLVA